MRTTPTAIKLNVAENLLTIEWADGHASTYDGGYLRFVCPCANCRGHAPGEVMPPAWGDVEAARVTGATQVGTYAVRFDMSDGHESGIYTYDLLRSVCPSENEGLDDRGRPSLD